MKLKKRYIAALIAAISIAFGHAELAPVLTDLLAPAIEASEEGADR